MVKLLIKDLIKFLEGVCIGKFKDLTLLQKVTRYVIVLATIPLVLKMVYLILVTLLSVVFTISEVVARLGIDNGIVDKPSYNSSVIEFFFNCFKYFYNL